MRRRLRILLLLLILLTLASPGRATAQAPVVVTDAAAQTPGRLVVFEGFLRAT